MVQEPSIGNKMLNKQLEFRFSTSVKGKRELARSKATKGLSKVGTGGVGKHFPIMTGIWSSRGGKGNGECSVDPF